MREPTSYGALAADLVVHLLRAERWHHLDDGTTESLRDFDVEFPDGHREALEVTTSSNAQESIQQDRTIAKYDWSVADWRSSWTVLIRPTGVSIKKLHKHLPSLLAEIEDAGLTVVAFEVQPDPVTAAFRARLHSIGVEHAMQLRWPGPPHIEVQLRLGGSFGADDVTVPSSRRSTMTATARSSGRAALRRATCSSGWIWSPAQPRQRSPRSPIPRPRLSFPLR